MFIPLNDFSQLVSLMFFHPEITQEKGEKDLKIVLTLKTSNQQQGNMIINLYTNQNKSCLISPVISQYFNPKDKSFVFESEVLIGKKRDLFKERFTTLLSSILNNEKIIYSKENFKFLLQISKIFDIKKLKVSVERYETYINELNQFNIGRLPIIDEEFLCQMYLHNLTYENIEDTKNASQTFIDHLTVDTYGQILFECIYSRLSDSDLYLDFIIHHMDNYYPHFIKTIEKNHRFCRSISDRYIDTHSVCNFLFRYFLENNYIKWDDIAMFKYGYSDHSTYQNFDHDHGNIHYNTFHYVYRNYEEISKDDFALHRKLVLIGKNQNPLFKAIEKDDIETFQKILAFNPSIDLDSTIENCYYDARPTFQKGSYSFLEIAAYFGSVKIFKYLLLNGATIRNDELCMMAIYGGNSEVIRICKQNELSFKHKSAECLHISIKMQHFDVLRWLIEEEKLTTDYYDFDLIKISLKRSNFFAFYYLLKVKYDIASSLFWSDSFYDEETKKAVEQNDDVNEEEEEDKKVDGFHFNFDDCIAELIIAYNIPVLRNYLTLHDQDLLNYPKGETTYKMKNFFDTLMINYDINIIDPLLKNNKIYRLENITDIAVSSFTFQQVARYLITNKNVSYQSNFIQQIISKLNIYEEMKVHKEFVEEQIKLLYEKSCFDSDKICLIPTFLLYKLTESDKYKEVLNLLKKIDKLKISENNYIDFILYTNVDMIKLIDSKLDSKKFRGFKVDQAIKQTKDVEKYFYSISTNKDSKFSKEDFFCNFKDIKSVEDMVKFIHLFEENLPNFYEKLFLPNVLFNVNSDQKEIIKYLLDLPEIQPYINKENKDYGNLPPLLYTGYFDEFVSNEKFDINIRQSETNLSLLSGICSEDLIKLLQNKKFKYTTEDIITHLEGCSFPVDTFHLKVILNGLLYENETNEIPIKIKFNFNDNQLTRLFNIICVKDDRVDMAKRFYSKYSDRIDVNYIDPISHHFSLLDAIDCDSINMVEFLLSISSLDLNRRGNAGYVQSHDFVNGDNITPFCFAVECGVDEIISLFIKRKNDFDINDTFSENVFYFSF